VALPACEYRLSICAIFQNEAPYLNEWIEYHYERGVEHFWLYNNNSNDDYEKILDNWISKDIVELIQWPSIQYENNFFNFCFKVQLDAYNDAINRSKNVSKWIAFIDVDEFIVPIEFYYITDLLEHEYPNSSGLCVNWQCYGTSNVNKCKRILNELVYKMRWDHEFNKFSKCIVNPNHVSHFINPHYCTFIPPYCAIDSHHNKCDECPSYVSIDKIRLNHYWTRDEDFLFNVKIPRNCKWGDNLDDILKRVNQMNEVYDPIISN